jgi:ComF family protein
MNWYCTVKLLLGNALFPAYCMSCRTAVDAVGTVCVECFQALQMISRPYCYQCGVPFSYALPEGMEDIACDACTLSPPFFDVARALWVYDEASAILIKRLKFSDKTLLAPYLAGLMRLHMLEYIMQADMVTPVPLHPRRLRERRYNQSLLLARALLPPAEQHKLRPQLLLRTRYTAAQTHLTYTERQRNVQDVFVVRPQELACVEGANIVLIDDVLTTGATANACAKILKNAGAAQVTVLTLAKRVQDNDYYPEE